MILTKIISLQLTVCVSWLELFWFNDLFSRIFIITCSQRSVRYFGTFQRNIFEIVWIFNRWHLCFRAAAFFRCAETVIRIFSTLGDWWEWMWEANYFIPNYDWNFIIRRTVWAHGFGINRISDKFSRTVNCILRFRIISIQNALRLPIWYFVV